MPGRKRWGGMMSPMREFELLSHIFAANPSLPPTVTVRPGDDMAVIELGERTLLIAVDQLADGLHVNLANTSLDRVARKLIVRNLSDVAAMAALPVASVATACLPRDFGDERAAALTDALQHHANAFQCPLIGGDVSIWDHPLLMTMTVLAEPGGITPVRRDAARVGDTVYVTGALGGAWDERGGGPHLTAEPRVTLARQLAARTDLELHAMIDISDGLAGDLGHICRMSRVAAELEAAAIPCRPGATCRNALSDGEDYELCFTATGSPPAEIDGVAITPVGRIVAAPSEADAPRLALIEPDGRSTPLTGGGWEHKDRS